MTLPILMLSLEEQIGHVTIEYYLNIPADILMPFSSASGSSVFFPLPFANFFLVFTSPDIIKI